MGSLALARAVQWCKRFLTMSLVNFEGSNTLKSLGMVSTSRYLVGLRASSSQGTRPLLLWEIRTSGDQNNIVKHSNLNLLYAFAKTSRTTCCLDFRQRASHGGRIGWPNTSTITSGISSSSSSDTLFSLSFSGASSVAFYQH